MFYKIEGLQELEKSSKRKLEKFFQRNPFRVARLAQVRP